MTLVVDGLERAIPFSPRPETAEAASKTLGERVHYLLTQESFKTIGKVLNGAGVVPMPLKGVLLQRLVYGESRPRRCSDIDLLVRPRDLDRARRAFRDAGFRFVSTVRNAETWAPQSIPFFVDLHWQLFAASFFDMPADDLFERGRPDEQLFGCDVVIPDPYDVYAHLIGHFVKGRLSATDTKHIEDFIQVAAAFGLDPVTCARHVERCGLGRAARYAVGIASELATDTFPKSFLGALSPDPMGDSLAALARAVLSTTRPGSKWGVVPCHLLNSSLDKAAISFWKQAAEAASRPFLRIAVNPPRR